MTPTTVKIEGPVKGPAVSHYLVHSKIEQALARLGYPQLGSIQYTVEGNSVILEGALESCYLSQIAQNAALTVPGITLVDNRIVVQ